MLEKILTFVLCFIGLCSDVQTQPTDQEIKISVNEYIKKLNNQDIAFTRDGGIVFMRRTTTSGNFLASTFAQKHHDWDQASLFLDGVLRTTPNEQQLLSRAMVLAMGAGQHDKGIKYAHKLHEQNPNQNASLTALFLIMEDFKNTNYDQAQTHLEALPQGSIADFIRPLLDSWVQAAQGKQDTGHLIGNTIHIYHAFLIGDYLGNREDFQALLHASLNADGLSVQDIERIADAYTLIGNYETAQKLYEKSLQTWPENKILQNKYNRLKNGETPVFFNSVKDPAHGVALALYDMAQLLFNESSDDSARVFAQMALYLDPSLMDAHIILGYIATKHNQYEDALNHYSHIPETHDRYLEGRRLSANLLEHMNRTEDAVNALKELAENFGDINSQIQIGDIYRTQKDFKKAVKAYNHAEDAMGGDITKEYWHLHYVRGMALEQYGDWNKAEADLKAALEFRPNHPLVLNYLGYAWADKGENLDQALQMIRKAVSLEPDDGYITDSLGWVLYRMGQFDEALPHLERAVELRPYDAIINDHLGDAYWQVGRKLEARFQWARAKNHAEDEKLLSDITHKLDNGLPPIEHKDITLKEAHATDAP